MGGRGSGSGIATSYQGKEYSKAQGQGITADRMLEKVASLSEKDQANTAVIDALTKVANNPNAKITIYRATVGDTINANDWVFLSKEQAEKWTRTAMGTKKPNVKVIQKTVKASEVDWTGKNLEFTYIPKRIRKS